MNTNYLNTGQEYTLNNIDFKVIAVDFSGEVMRIKVEFQNIFLEDKWYKANVELETVYPFNGKADEDDNSNTVGKRIRHAMNNYQSGLRVA